MKSEDSTLGSLVSALKTRPEIIGMLIIVGGFLYHMQVTESNNIEAQEKRDSREDLVARQRIQICHDIQVLGIEALDRNSAALIMQSASDSTLTESIDTLSFNVTSNTDGIRQIHDVLSSMSDQNEWQIRDINNALVTLSKIEREVTKLRIDNAKLTEIISSRMPMKSDPGA